MKVLLEKDHLCLSIWDRFVKCCAGLGLLEFSTLGVPLLDNLIEANQPLFLDRHDAWVFVGGGLRAWLSFLWASVSKYSLAQFLKFYVLFERALGLERKRIFYPYLWTSWNLCLFQTDRVDFVRVQLIRRFSTFLYLAKFRLSFTFERLCWIDFTLLLLYPRTILPAQIFIFSILLFILFENALVVLLDYEKFQFIKLLNFSELNRRL